MRTNFGDELDTTIFSRLALEALLANGATFYSVSSFLRDPSLNVPEANNFETLISHPWATRLSKEAYNDLLEILKQTVTIGVLLPAEIERALPLLKFRIKEIFPPDEAQSALLGIYQALWKGVKACRLTRISPKLARLFAEEACTLRRTHGPAATLISDLCRHTWLIPTAEDPAAFAYPPQWNRRGEQTAMDTAFCAPVALDRALFTKILRALPHTGFSDLVASAKIQFVEAVRSSGPDQSSWLETLVLWLDCIRSSALTRSNTRDVLSDLHKTLSTELPLSVLSPLLKVLSDLRICHVLLEIRIPGLIEADVPMYNILANRFRSQLVANSLGEPDETASFAALVHAVQQTTKSRARIPMVEVFELVYDLYGPKVFHRFLKRCLDTNIVIYPDAVSAILKRTIVEDDPQLAFAIWRMRRVWISTCPELVLSLIRKTSTHSERIFRMLSHRDPSNSVPYSLRTSRKNPLSQSRIDLIHSVALSFAQRKSKSSRVALRDVYQCYIYLCSRKAALQPAMSRALVLSGILRPLNENRYVSAGLVTWMMKVVERVEGKEVSEKLEMTIYRWRARIQRRLQVDGEWKDNKEDIQKPIGASGVWLPHRRSGVSVNEYRYLPKWYKQAMQKLESETSETETLEANDNGSNPLLAGLDGGGALAEKPTRFWDWSLAEDPIELAKNTEMDELVREETGGPPPDQPFTETSQPAVDVEAGEHDSAKGLDILNVQSLRGAEKSQIRRSKSSRHRREWPWDWKVLIQGEVARKQAREAQQKAKSQG